MKYPQQMPRLPIITHNRGALSKEILGKLRGYKKSIEVIDMGGESFVIAFKKYPKVVFAYDNPHPHLKRNVLNHEQFQNAWLLHRILNLLFPEKFPKIYAVFGVGKNHGPYQKIINFLSSIIGNGYIYGSIRERIFPIRTKYPVETKTNKPEHELHGFYEILEKLNLEGLSNQIETEEHNWILTEDGYKFVDLIATFHPEQEYLSAVLKEVKENRDAILDYAKQKFDAKRVKLITTYINKIQSTY